jgi:hypothetical protein
LRAHIMFLEFLFVFNRRTQQRHCGTKPAIPVQR